MSIFVVEGLEVSAGERTLVHGVSFSISAGECVALVGESGSGKSLSSFAPFGLVDGVHVRGTAKLRGQELIGTDEANIRPIRARDVGFIFQQPLNALTPHRTVAQHLVEAVGAKPSRAQLLDMLAEVGLHGDLLTRYPHQLSGGQRQRVMIAMSVAHGPKLLVADEPTTALDAALRNDVMTLIDTLRKSRELAVLLVSHDLLAVADHADRVVVLREGRVEEAGAAADVLNAPRSDYAKALVGARLVPHPLKEEIKAGAALLSAANISVSYLKSGWRGGRIMAVDNVSFDVRAGEAVALLGGSGSGKSTLARAIVRLGPCESGEVLWQGVPLPPRAKMKRAHRRFIQPVFQDPQASLDPLWRVIESVAEPLRAFAPELGKTAREAKAFQALADVELAPDFADRRVRTLSGGQAQRVAIARALVSDPQMLLLDEATSALDVLTVAAIVALLQRLRAERGLSLLIITHDERLAAALCDRVIRLEAGRLVASD